MQICGFLLFPYIALVLEPKPSAPGNTGILLAFVDAGVIKQKIIMTIMALIYNLTVMIDPFIQKKNSQIQNTKDIRPTNFMPKFGTQSNPFKFEINT
jgi:hypothetical protein